MDANTLGDSEVHNINILTVIASESYESFAKGLQEEIAEAVADRPRKITIELFTDKIITNTKGEEHITTKEEAQKIYNGFVRNNYVDDNGQLTDKYYSDKKEGTLEIHQDFQDYQEDLFKIAETTTSQVLPRAENARSNNVELHLRKDKLAMAEFKALWKRISPKSAYIVNFDTEELVKKSVESLDAHLRVASAYFRVSKGVLEEINSKEDLLNGTSFVREGENQQDVVKAMKSNSSVKYDLIGKLVDETGLTRKDVISILKGIQPSVFNQLKNNPEEFILKASKLINEQKATAIIQHITYNMLDESYNTDVFTDHTVKGQLTQNAIKTNKHLYDHVVYDSKGEKDFAEKLDTDKNVAVYVKLPSGFYISTPVGHYNPDWAIAFYEGSTKHIYFVAETKGDTSSLQLRSMEGSKIHCAREHFKAISNSDVTYDVVDGYSGLLSILRS
jgi:type III restriction enzyme